MTEMVPLFRTGDDVIALKESLPYSDPDPDPDADESIRSRPREADEYARWNGLTVDTFLDDPWEEATAPVDNGEDIISATLDHYLEPGCLFELDEDLQECLFRAIIPTPEQPDLSAGSLRLIQEACKTSKEHEVWALMEELCFLETSEQKRLKLEPPLLATDHDRDCRRVAHKLKALAQAPVSSHGLSPIPTEAGSGEGLEFSDAEKKGDAELMEAFGKETLEVTRESLLFLVESLRTEWTDGDRQDLFESVSTYKGPRLKEHLTPPLSPLTPPSPGYFIPTDEDCEVPEPSEIGSGISDDIEAAELTILEEDINFWNEISAGQPPSPDRYDDLDVSEMIRSGELSSPSPPSPRPLPNNIKIETPLILPETDDWNQHAPTKVLDPEDLAKARGLMDSSDTVLGDLGGREQELMDFMEVKALSLMRSAEQEKLQPLDAIARMPVPVMDFSLPVPEWVRRPWKPEEMFKLVRETLAVNWDRPKWLKNEIVEQQLVWLPISHMGEMSRRVLVSEAIEADPAVLKSLLELPRSDEVRTSGYYAVKTPGLAILRPRGDEDSEIDSKDEATSVATAPDVSPASILEPEQILTAAPDAPQPEIAMDIEGKEDRGPSTTQAETKLEDSLALVKGKKRPLNGILLRKAQAGKMSSSSAALLDLIDSGATTLAVQPSMNIFKGFDAEYADFGPFLKEMAEVRSRKKPKTVHSSYFKRLDPSLPPVSAETQAVKEEAKPEPPPDHIPAVSPDVAPPDTSPKVVVSSAVSVLITKRLRELIPGIKFLKRDYARHRPPGWIPGLRSPNMDESDIAISPMTGILMTTMVKLRQKPVPGKAGQLGFRHVAENVASRYGRLIVLISEGNKHSETTTPLSQADTKALAEFQGCMAGLETRVQIAYVGGDNETLAKWVAGAICNYALEAAPVQDLLLPMETNWELFLRRAGMNAYAAQVALGVLKVPDGEPAMGGAQLHGLPLFVMMHPEERVSALESAMGGRLLLDRVSGILDEPWGQRALETPRPPNAEPWNDAKTSHYEFGGRR